MKQLEECEHRPKFLSRTRRFFILIFALHQVLARPLPVLQTTLYDSFFLSQAPCVVMRGTEVFVPVTIVSRAGGL